MYSFGFQDAFQRGIEARDNVFLTKVLTFLIRRRGLGLSGSFEVL